MKIYRDKKEEVNRFTTRPKSEPREVMPVKQAIFEQELNYHKEKDIHLRMQEYLQELDKLTAKLQKTLTINDLMMYKKLVKGFLKEAISKAYLLNLEPGRSRRGRAILLSVNLVDEEVEGVIQDFMQKKLEPIEVLSSLDKIRGMLVDLLA